MKKLALLTLFCIFLSGIQLVAQDSLPNFSVKNVGARRIILGWNNQFREIRQISIQRSFDSLKNFKTILTVADPTTPQNGYVDTKATNDHMFYRLYILLDQGVYIFSPSRRPLLDTARVITNTNPVTGVVTYDTVDVISNVRLQKPGTNSSQLPILGSDSLQANHIINDNRPKAEKWVASKFIYTIREGSINIRLPEDATKEYSIKFFTLDDVPLFELKELKERSFKIDKTNFYHAGWFKFELYEDGKLKEKNRFYLQKEF